MADHVIGALTPLSNDLHNAFDFSDWLINLAVMHSATVDEQLDETFFALANSTRRAILSQLANGEASVNELAEPFDMSLPAISKHLKVLERAGLITRRREGKTRPCALDTERLDAARKWVDEQHVVWTTSFDRLDRQLNTSSNGNH